MTNQLNLESIIQRNESKYLANSLGEETVLMNIETGDYLGINGVGTDIWNILSNPLKIEDLIKEILKLYDVSEEMCTSQVNTFLDTMLKQSMLTITSA